MVGTLVLANRTIIDTLSLAWLVRDGDLATPLRASRLPKHVRYLATLLPAGLVLRKRTSLLISPFGLGYTAPYRMIEATTAPGRDALHLLSTMERPRSTESALDGRDVTAAEHQPTVHRQVQEVDVRACIGHAPEQFAA